jgi:hypothetical protein
LRPGRGHETGVLQSAMIMMITETNGTEESILIYELLMKSASWSFEAVFWLLLADSDMYFGIQGQDSFRVAIHLGFSLIKFGVLITSLG